MNDGKPVEPASGSPPEPAADQPQPIDPRALDRLRKLGGDRLILRMIDLFLAHAGPRVDEARMSLSAGDLAGLERAAHSVKSSAGNLGASQLFELAGKLEGLSRAPDGGAGDAATLEGVIAEFEAAFVRVKAHLEERRSELEQ